MTLDELKYKISLLSREAAKAARFNPDLNDAADALYVLCVKLEVPEILLPPR